MQRGEKEQRQKKITHRIRINKRHFHTFRINQVEFCGFYNEIREIKFSICKKKNSRNKRNSSLKRRYVQKV